MTCSRITGGSSLSLGALGAGSSPGFLASELAEDPIIDSAEFLPLEAFGFGASLFDAFSFVVERGAFSAFSGFSAGATVSSAGASAVVVVALVLLLASSQATSEVASKNAANNVIVLNSWFFMSNLPYNCSVGFQKVAVKKGGFCIVNKHRSRASGDTL